MVALRVGDSDMLIKFTYCKNFAEAETKEVEWDKFADAMARSQAFPSKEASVRRAAFVGGLRADEDKGRANGNIISRTVATLDYDAPPASVEEIEFALSMALDCAYVAYSTFRHTPVAPRFRLCVPLSRPVNEAEYHRVVDEIVSLVNLGPVDKCSFVMSQIMFLPSHKDGVTPFSIRNDGEPWQVPEAGIPASVAIERIGAVDDGDDLAAAVSAHPLDLTLEEVDAILEGYPAEGKDYDEWLRVGMALWHQFEGSDDGWRRWLAWSALSAKHDDRHMRVKWRSFGGSTRPVTMASVIQLAGGFQAAVEIAPAGSTYATLRAEAEAVDSQVSYARLRDRVRSMSEAALPVAMRAELAQALYVAFGRGVGMTKAEVKKDLKPKRRKVAGNDGDGFQDTGEGDDGREMPSWLQDWVFSQADNSFERVSVRHSMGKDAFRFTYASQPDVLAADMDPVTYASVACRMPVVANLMYWPGAERLFRTPDGLRHLNTYIESGIEPCETLEGDEEAAEVIRRFKAHVANTVASERERTILIDFMAYVIQNPGKRVRWALLMHGIEGNGKSYFFRVLQNALGERARVVSTTAINSNFTGWAEGALLVGVEEIRIAGTNKYAILDKMKPLISNDSIAVVHKGKDEKHIPNFTSYMMFTNHADAIPVGDNDRRYCVISTRHSRKSDLFDQHGGEAGAARYFDRLFSLSDKRADALARFLLDWEISADFNPAGRAPETDGLVTMRGLHVSEERDDVELAIETHACAVIGPDLIDVTHLNACCLMDGTPVSNRRALAHILSDMGYKPIPERRIKLSRSRINHYIWHRDGGVSVDEAKRRVREFHEAKDGFS